MKIKIIILTILFSLLILPQKTFAFSDNFNALILEESITKLANPGHTYYLKINLENNLPSQTVYPVSFSLDGDSFSTSNSWITFGYSSIILNNAAAVELNFALTVPTDTPAGEYTKVVAVSDIPFIEGLSLNPPTAIGIPIIVQITEQEIVPTATPTPTSSPTPTPTVSPTSASPTQTTITAGTTTPTPTPKSIVKVVTPQPTPFSPPKTDETNSHLTQKYIDDLYCKVEVKKVRPKFDPFKQVTTIYFDITNLGNITSIPRGSIDIRTLTGKPVATLSLNPKDISVSPNEIVTLKAEFQSEKYLLGIFKAEIMAANSSSLGETPLKSVSHVYFLHIGLQPIIVVVVSLLSFLAIYKLPYKKRSHYRTYLAFPLIIISLGFLGYDLYLTHNISQNPLGTDSEISVSGEVKQVIGIKTVTLPSLEKAIIISAINPLGVSIWSLQDTSRSMLLEISEPSLPLHQYLLPADEESYPILLLPLGF